jgi:histidyl-tRNA synthetase
VAKSKNSFQPPRGMRDVYPEDMRLRNQLFDAWRSSAERHGFSHYDACVVESLDLLKRKAGEEIVDQIYAFQDKSGRDLALRPEMTPTLARMVAAKQGSLTFPLKWFTIAQCFRYERTTRGRKREHFQWNLDIIGEPSLHAEAEIIAAAIDGMSGLGLGAEDIVIDFSNRAMLSEILANLGIKADDHAAAFVALDKRGKIPDDQIKTILGEYGLSDDRVGKVFDVLAIQSMEHVADVLPADCESYQDLLRFVELMDTYGLAAHLNFNIGVIRGLAYYTGIVFEAFDAGRELRAVFGGGRYDNLLSSIGGAPATAVGLGFGDVVVGELLAMKHAGATVAPQGGTRVGYMQEAQRQGAIKVAVALRTAGTNVDLALSPEKAKKFFQRCDRGGFTEAVYIGPDDLAKGVVRVKTLATREEREMGV